MKVEFAPGCGPCWFCDEETAIPCLIHKGEFHCHACAYLQAQHGKCYEAHDAAMDVELDREIAKLDAELRVDDVLASPRAEEFLTKVGFGPADVALLMEDK